MLFKMFRASFYIREILHQSVAAHSKIIYLSSFHAATASKVYTNAVAKTQKIWPAYLESIMKVNNISDD